MCLIFSGGQSQKVQLISLSDSCHIYIQAKHNNTKNSCIFQFSSNSESDQLAWATQESQYSEEGRLQRMREQEQADLELAIALSKAEMQSSDA